MSRFFRSVSDSESDSDFSDNESLQSSVDYSSGEEGSQVDTGEQQPQRSLNARFLKGNGSDDSDEDSDEDRRRHMKSKQTKQHEALIAFIDQIEEAKDDEDWGTIAKTLSKLTSKVGTTSGVIGHKIPKIVIKAVADLRDFLEMNSNNAKGKNIVKQRIKKLPDVYIELCNKYDEDPEAFMEESEEEEEEEEEETKTAAKSLVKVELTSDDVLKGLCQVMEVRGRKNTDHASQTQALENLKKTATTPFQKILVLLALIVSRFDASPSTLGHLNIQTWKAVEEEISTLLEILENDHRFAIVEDAPELDYNELTEVTPKEGEVISIRGSVITYVERLDDEFTKSLQSIDPHTTDYIDRLRDEPSLYALLVRTQVYLERQSKDIPSLTKITMRRLEHLYYKPEQVIRSIEQAATEQLPSSITSLLITAQEPSQLIHQLCAYLYKHDESVLRIRAILCHIYHYALHKNYHQARDMLLLSHLQDTIHQADIQTQILYNRVMVQIGMCAFRHGLIKDAHACLQDIQASGRVKELLAQGIPSSRYTQQPMTESDLQERLRQLPFHMHINLELLECIFLTCSMLLEIPAQAQAGPNSKKFISRTFRRLLDYNEKQAFSGPPENTRDHIMSASKALASGEWEKARDYISAIKIWDLMPEKSQIKEMLERKIQEEGLRTYLFTYASYYSTLSLETLSNVFGLPIPTVSAIISKMVWNEELAASLDQVTQCVVLHQVELSPLQVQALQYSEKVANLAGQINV